MNDTVLLIHCSATWFMIGLIWIVQVVHYPLWVYVDGRESRPLHQKHSRSTGWLVGTVGGVEFMSAAMLLVSQQTALTVAGVTILIAIWIVTVAVQVPLHRQLESEWSEPVIARLVRGNWIRTILWSVRGLIAMTLLRQ
jgi:hypothetical protein